MSWSRRNKIWFLVAIVLGCVGLDQATKVLSHQYLVRAEPIRYLGDTIRLQYAENTGAFLSAGAGMSEGARFYVFVIGVSVLLTAMTAYLILSKHVARLEVVAFAMVIAGGVGNLIDRIALGYVRDFMNVGFGGLRTGIFNVADMSITGGALVILLHLFLERSQKKRAAGRSGA